MSISTVDICNLALSSLGDPGGVTSVFPPDDSAQAKYCSTYYPIALRTLLSAHAWSFATRRVVLAEIDNPTQQWAYRFALPSDFIGIQTLLSDREVSGVPFRIELSENDQLVLYADEKINEIIYNSDRINITLAPPLFIDALSLTLQYYLAGSIIKGDVGVSAKNNIFKQMRTATALAMANDANRTRSKEVYVPSITRAHDGYSGAEFRSGSLDNYPPSYVVY